MRYKQFAPQILREYNRDITAQKFGLALLQKFQKEPVQWQDAILPLPRQLSPEAQASAIQQLLAKIERGDPTPNKQYVPWMIKSYVNTPHQRFEDAITKPTEYLRKFFKLVQKRQIPQPHNDINRIPNFTALTQIVDQYPDVVDEPKNVNRGQADAYYEDADIRVIIPQDETAACYYGQGTRWCTAAREHNMFDRYNQQGRMYIILPKKPAYAGEKYQFHFESKQFMNEKDQRVNLKELRARFPQLADVFAKQAADNGVISLDKGMDDIQAHIDTILPLFGKVLRTMIANEGRSRVAREIANELGQASRVFRGMTDELWELADMMLEEDVVPAARKIMGMVQDLGVEIVNDEDQLYDHLGDLIGDIRRDSDLWIYITEMLEELEDDEGEFECAMVIEGELSSLLINLIPKAFKEAMDAFKRSAPAQ